MAEAILLGDLELTSVASIEIFERRKLARQAIPGWNGDLVQDLGAAASRVRVSGTTFGASAADQLEQLRAAAAEGAPLPFVASAAVATGIEELLVERLWVRQLAGEMDTYHYVVDLIQHVRPPPLELADYAPALLTEIAAEAEESAGFDVDTMTAIVGTAGEAGAFIADAIATAKALGEGIEGLLAIEQLLEALARVARSAL